MNAPECPITRQGWWDYAEETNSLLEETGRALHTWSYFLPWNMWRVNRRHALISARLREQRRAMENEWFGFS
jgi:hypothetical protein